MYVDLKPLLIDLEGFIEPTGRKQDETVQRERLSEEAIKKCSTCNKYLPFQMFDYRGGDRKGLQPNCKNCCKKLAREFRQKNRNLVGKWKLRKGCSACGFKAIHSVQLDLDHINPETKTYKGKHNAFDAGWSKVRIKQELAKCQILCKNCHALKTFMSGDWKNKFVCRDL